MRLRRRGSLFEESEEGLRVSGSVTDAQDLHATFCDAVIDNVIAGREGTEARFEFRAAASDFGMFGEEFEDFEDPDDEVPGRLHIAAGEVIVHFLKVAMRALRELVVHPLAFTRSRAR